MNQISNAAWLFIIISIASWLFSFYLDERRIRHDIESRGGRLSKKEWLPFGKGWGGGSGRTYDVCYADSSGDIHQAICRTSLLAGVYWADDINFADADRELVASALEANNRRLRKELKELRQNSTGKPSEIEGSRQN